MPEIVPLPEELMAPPRRSGGVARERAAGDREVAVAVDAAAAGVAELPVTSVS